ncbi:MAG: polysaccharide deacetylase family protein, partial [Gemmatimonadota bacterium]
PPPLAFLPRRRVIEEVRRADWVLASLAGRSPVHFRPPSGWATPALLRIVAEEGYRAVLGTIYPADPRAPDARTIASRAIARLAPGRILILHDGSSRGASRARTVEALPAILAQLEARGMRGVSVRELLSAAPAPVAAGLLSAGRDRDRRRAAAPGSPS